LPNLRPKLTNPTLNFRILWESSNFLIALRCWIALAKRTFNVVLAIVNVFPIHEISSTCGLPLRACMRFAFIFVMNRIYAFKGKVTLSLDIYNKPWNFILQQGILWIHYGCLGQQVLLLFESCVDYPCNYNVPSVW